MKICLALLLFSACFFVSNAQSPVSTVHIEKFLVQGDSDCTAAVRKAVEYCQAVKAQRLVFPKGRYDFWPDYAKDVHIAISNNDGGAKRVVFDLEGVNNLEIDGQGSLFIFHGLVVPFVVSHGSQVGIKNVSIDWGRTFDSEGKILAVQKDYVDLEFGEEYPYKIENGQLVFYDRAGVLYPYGGLLEFDPVKRETAYMALDVWTKFNFQATELSPGKVRMYYPDPKLTPGNVLVFNPVQRPCPAIILSDCSDVVVSGSNIYHAGGMAIIAQRSRNILVDHVKVTPKPGSSRMVSASADATHFSNCTGKITLSNCLFENQLDDATNIHGIYVKVVKKVSPTELIVKLVHPQQFGFDFLSKGKAVEFTHGKSMIDYGSGRIRGSWKINDEYTRVSFEEALPAGLVVNEDVMAETNTNPEVLITQCVIRNNRARGILLGSRGPITIENNLFHTPGAAILFEGDAQYWFERSGVRNAVIRNNKFEDCNYGVWGNAVIQIGSTINPEFRDQSRYNRHIVIEGNSFKVFDPRILHLYSVEGLVFMNNEIKKSTDYPAWQGDQEPFSVASSTDIRIDAGAGAK